jgi:hypothetical protein
MVPVAVIAPVIAELKQALKTSGGWSQDWVEEMNGVAVAGGVSYEIVETANLFFEWDPGKSHHPFAQRFYNQFMDVLFFGPNLCKGVLLS